jgi:hypothetical protein
MALGDFKTALDGHLYVLHNSRSRKEFRNNLQSLVNLRNSIEIHKNQKYDSIINTINNILDSVNDFDSYNIQNTFENPCGSESVCLTISAYVSSILLAGIYIASYALYFK